MSDEAIKGPASIFHELWDTFRKLDTKPISDWIALVLKIMGGIGAFLLIVYAAKEHFFYDLSSLAAISLLLLVAFAFSFLVAAAAFYAVVSMIWLPVALFWVISWTTRRLAPAEGQAATGYNQVACRLLVFHVPFNGKLYIGRSVQAFGHLSYLALVCPHRVCSCLSDRHGTDYSYVGQQHPKKVVIRSCCACLAAFFGQRLF